jgi:hypothetical protein
MCAYLKTQGTPSAVQGPWDIDPHYSPKTERRCGHSAQSLPQELLKGHRSKKKKKQVIK